jgi:hypothetical protein
MVEVVVHPILLKFSLRRLTWVLRIHACDRSHIQLQYSFVELLICFHFWLRLLGLFFFLLLVLVPFSLVGLVVNRPVQSLFLPFLFLLLFRFLGTVSV